MTLGEAARELGISAGTLRNQVLAGKLKAEKVGKFWVVRPREVERYRAEHLGQRKGGPKPGKKR